MFHSTGTNTCETITQPFGSLYSWHATELECISKRKAHAPYEFGCKVSLATDLHPTQGGHFILHTQALHGNPYDGHTLQAALEDIRQNLTMAETPHRGGTGYRSRQERRTAGAQLAGRPCQ
jgi:transposase, IS5 family